MFNLRSATDVSKANSFSNKMRRRRFDIFKKLYDQIPKPVKIIDIGGTAQFWEQVGFAGRSDVDVVAINLAAGESGFDNIKIVKGDACNLSEFGDQEFDIAFSNSVIEHLFTFENQRRMAEEVQRVAKAYWVQTPNFWFPMEPHFHVPGWQWMPLAMCISLIQKRRCGWRGPYTNREDAKLAVEEVRLMTRSEMKELFPKSQIWDEPFFGLVKSIVAYDGFSDPS
ncbi:class I SAM-dependent methyltransferase [Sneathiella sp.]|uniref:class I SAM-dependent methyltransferase n=1 Tax=Sneathiella sp. TaxID=1964365 RepID=UPI003562716C